MLLNYDINYNADVKRVVLDKVKNYKEMSEVESKNLNTIFSNLQNNEFTKLLFNLLTMTNLLGIDKVINYLLK